jgi:PAS domain S-box-containing protein
VATDLAIGTMDESSRIREIASSTDVVLGFENASMIGRHLLDFVHPDDADDVQRALCATVDDGTDTTVMVRARHADGEWINVLWLTFRGPGPDAESLAFALAEPTAAARTRPQIDRAAALEQHLRRISSELTAAGLLAANPAAIPEEESRVLADLSARQREIVTRLMRGERVPGIAAAMHLSPATVRNHLTRVFERFGVHSQAEMIAVLRSPHGDAPVP